MLLYLARRLALGLLTVWLVTLAAFLLLRIAPGDAVTAAIARSPGEGGLLAADSDELRKQMGLDRSWPVQYLDWLGGAARLDAGKSLATGRPVASELGPRLLVTVELAVLAIGMTTVIGLAGGLLAARYANTLAGNAIRAAASAAHSIPTFWIALLLIIGVANWTNQFLALGYKPLWDSPAANLAAILPAATVLALRPGAITMRVSRASTLEMTSAQYFLMARARGVSRGQALIKHAFRTATLPTVTVLGGQAVLMLSGAVVIEQVFGLPGLGRALVDAVLSRDFPVVQALFVIFGVFAVLLNLATDLAYLRLDPRLRLPA